MTIVIVEGCDAVGKDTFAEMLSKKIGYEIVRGSSFEISKLGADGMFKHAMDILNQKDNIILNRSFYSNLVYGSLFDYPMMNPEQYDELVDKIDEKAIVVYLHAPKGIIEYRMRKRGDDMIKVENIDDILAKYNEELFGEYRPSNILTVDTSQKDMNKAVELVVKLCDS